MFAVPIVSIILLATIIGVPVGIISLLIYVIMLYLSVLISSTYLGKLITKKIFEKIINKFINFCKWVWKECKDWHTLVLFIIVVIVMYTPVWGGYLLYFLFKSKWAMGVASTYLVFWAGPFTPYFPLCIAITLGIKKLFDKFKSKRDKREIDIENDVDDE